MDRGEATSFDWRQDKFILPEGVTVRDPQRNQYVIEGILGRGEFGAVYLVKERRSQRLFALKEVINPNKSERGRFAFEGKILTRLRHRALPRVHHAFENDKLKRVYLLMDYIRGHNLEILREEQAEKRFPLPLVLTLMAPVVDALVYLHSQNPPIVHRDVKPANIIVPAAGGEAVLVDFGSAKEYIPGAVTTTVHHRSHGYAAPELYRTGTTPLTDIYGLGATLYTLLTGSIPMDAPSRIMISWEKDVDPLRPANRLNPDVPLTVSQAIERAMAINPTDRFGTVEEFWRVVAHHNEQQTTPASIEVSAYSATGQTGKDDDTQAHIPVNRSIAPSLLAGLVALVAICLGFVAYFWGNYLLLFCLLGVALLSLGVLLHRVSFRVRD